jgi:hypothetical protein
MLAKLAANTRVVADNLNSLMTLRGLSAKLALQSLAAFFCSRLGNFFLRSLG